MVDLDVGSGVVVALHGHGDEPADARRWARGVAPPAWEIVAPGAPVRDGARSWFSTGPRGVDRGELDESVDRVGDVVRRVRAAGRPAVLVGFSQGGALALAATVAGVVADAVVALCPFWPDTGEELEPDGGDAPVLLLAADADEVVPAHLAEDAAGVLRACGRTARTQVLEGTHSVGPSMAGVAREWLVEQFRRGPRVSVGLPLDRGSPELVGGEPIGRLATSVERLGFRAVHAADPAPFPFPPGGDPQRHRLEPTVALAVAAAHTRRLMLRVDGYRLARRDPVAAALALASLGTVADGRLIVGVAADDAARGPGERGSDEVGPDGVGEDAPLGASLQLLRRIGSGEGARGLSLWLTGGGLDTMRLAVRVGDGWSFLAAPGDAGRSPGSESMADHAAVRPGLGRLRELCEQEGRTTPLTTCVTTCVVPFTATADAGDPRRALSALADEVGLLHDLGVDWLSLEVPGTTVGEFVDHAAAVADRLGLR